MSNVLVPRESLKRRSGLREDHTTENVNVWLDPPGSGPPYIVSTTEVYTACNDESYVGWDIPDYHKKLRSGVILPHTPFMHYTNVGASEGAALIVLSSGAKYYSDGNNSKRAWSIPAEQVWSYAPEQFDMYVQEAAAKIYSSGHDTLTFLAELVEVKHMFSQTLVKLLKLKIPKNPKALASEWLSARYGWRTLIFDINQLNETFSSLNEKRTRYSEKSRGKTGFTTIHESGTVNYGSYDVAYLISDKVEIQFVGSVMADVWIPKFQFNPLTTGWELVPYSFVLDWFVSVGKALCAMSFLVLQSEYAASAGFRLEVTRTYQHDICSSTSEFSSGYNYQYATSEATLEKREPCKIPLTPHLKLRLNSYKIIDLLGMFIQRYRR